MIRYSKHWNMAKLEPIYCKRKNKNVLSQKVTIDSIDEKYCLFKIGCKYKVSYEDNILAVFTNYLAFCTSEAVRQMIPRLTRWENMWGKLFYTWFYISIFIKICYLLTPRRARKRWIFTMTMNYYYWWPRRCLLFTVHLVLSINISL